MRKVILDACCGSRMFWFDKENPNVLYVDKRKEHHTLCDGRSLDVAPDVQADFRQLPFSDNTFYHVVFDPPHLVKLGATSWMAKKYGILSENWQEDIRRGFDECMRVLKPFGTLIFKWNEDQIKVNDIIDVIGVEPLYGHTTRRNSTTIWMCFMKLLKE